MLIEMIQFDEDGLIGLGLAHELRPLKSPKSDGDSSSEPCLGPCPSSGSESSKTKQATREVTFPWISRSYKYLMINDKICIMSY
jgi:hypothetical protein